MIELQIDSNQYCRTTKYWNANIALLLLSKGSFLSERYFLQYLALLLQKYTDLL